MGRSGAFVDDQRKEPYARIAVELLRRFGQLIGLNGIAVYALLSSYANNKTHAVQVYHSTLARDANVSERTISRAIKLLIKYKLVFFESGKDKGQANRYILRDLPSYKPSASAPLFEGDAGGGMTPAPTPHELQNPSNGESVSYESGEGGVGHPRRPGRTPAPTGCDTSADRVGQNGDRNKGTSRLIQSTTGTNPQIENQNLGEGLTALEYARKLLEDIGIPHAGNFLIASDSISALSVSEGLPLFAAYQEMRARALEARSRGAPVKWHLWFLNGEYAQSQSRTKNDEFNRRFDEASEILQRREQSRAKGAG